MTPLEAVVKLQERGLTYSSFKITLVPICSVSEIYKDETLIAQISHSVNRLPFLQYVSQEFSNLEILQQSAVKNAINVLTTPTPTSPTFKQVFHLKFIGDADEWNSYLNIKNGKLKLKFFGDKHQTSINKTKFTHQEISAIDLTGLTKEFAGWIVEERI